MEEFRELKEMFRDSPISATLQSAYVILLVLVILDGCLDSIKLFSDSFIVGIILPFLVSFVLSRLRKS